MHARFRSTLSLLLLFICAVVFAAPTFAADAASDKAKAEADAAMAEMMKNSMPGPMHALLKPLAGNWKASVKSYMGPEPTVSEGTCERVLIMGDRYLQSKHSGNFAGMPFEGMEILTYDNMKKQFTNVWIDNMVPMLMVGKDGKADASGKVITINSVMDDPITKKPVPVKMVTKVVDQNTNVFTMTCYKEGKDVMQMEITYTRVQ